MLLFFHRLWLRPFALFSETMSTDTRPPATNPSREQRRFEARIGGPIRVLVAGRVVEGVLRDVEVSHRSIRTALALCIEHDAGVLRVSPGAVVG